ncbi:thiamine pyrophosphate-binding protein [Dactylosporangium sp. NPDC051485]|uniref:thiamine pyrophosphate-binding protein n=1 Tax=Dactylosporangium sp. NPDC051485 TaxID=3154846 RepID=UPI003444DEDD
MPGYFVMPVWQTFTKAPQIVLARHESGAGFMADGYSRLSGKLGVVLATIGPGMTNCVTGVACAYRDSVPLLVITGQAPTATYGRGAFLESYILDRAVSPAALFSPITKKSIEIIDPANAAFLIDAAIGLALSGRPGPVHLSIPIDLQQQDIPVPAATDGAPAPAPGPVVTAAVLDGPFADAAAALGRAERPLVLAGWGASRAGVGADVGRLAEATGAAVVTTTKAVSCLPATHPLLLGHLGPGQRSDIVAAVQEYRPDVVAVLGASLSAFYATPLQPLLAGATLIRADVDADQLGLRATPDIALHGDLTRVAPALADAARRERGERVAGPAAELVARFQDRGRRASAALGAEFDGAASMSGAVARLSALLPDDTVVVPDAGNHWLDTISLHRAPLAGGLQLNCGIGAMGWAIGAAVGMAFARPAGRTVCITGDGSMLMHGAELSVAAEHGLNLLTVVFNNASHARVRLGQQQDFNGDTLATDIPEIDFGRWMGALGVRHLLVERPDQVEPVFREALALAGTVGVEVRCRADEVPASMRAWIEDVPA